MWGWIKSLFGGRVDEFRNPDFVKLWESCVVDLARTDEIAKVCHLIIQNKEKYLAVQAQTGVPWYMVAALHYREASLNFKTCLHNGDPLPGPTKHVPAGRGPFKSWEEAAIDALEFDGLHKAKMDTIPECLSIAQRYNGMGYTRKGIYSPYVWAGTNHYKIGKYTGDGAYNPFFKDKQLGVAALLKGLSQEI